MNYAKMASVSGDSDDEANELASLFRDIDKRGTDRTIGLRSMRAGVSYYYQGSQAAMWVKAIDSMLADIERTRAAERAAEAKRVARNARRRKAYRAKRDAVTQVAA